MTFFDDPDDEDNTLIRKMKAKMAKEGGDDDDNENTLIRKLKEKFLVEGEGSGSSEDVEDNTLIRTLKAKLLKEDSGSESAKDVEENTLIRELKSALLSGGSVSTTSEDIEENSLIYKLKADLIREAGTLSGNDEEDNTFIRQIKNKLKEEGFDGEAIDIGDSTVIRQVKLNLDDLEGKDVLTMDQITSNLKAPEKRYAHRFKYETRALLYDMDTPMPTSMYTKEVGLDSLTLLTDRKGEFELGKAYYAECIKNAEFDGMRIKVKLLRESNIGDQNVVLLGFEIIDTDNKDLKKILRMLQKFAEEERIR